MSSVPTNNTAPYLWLENQWQQLSNALTQQTLPHAWLFGGTAGLGKRALAEHFAQTVLCEQQTACGECSSCRQFQAGAHPDFAHLTIPDDKKTIPIDAVRQLISRLTLTKSTSAWTVAIIEPAEAMNRNAANALLKTLEEPTPNTLLLLVTEQPAQLLPTIRSRCVQMRFSPPATDLAISWLQSAVPSLADRADIALRYAGGAPLAAAAFADNDFLARRSRFIQALNQLLTRQTFAVNIAKEFKDEPLADVHLWISYWLMDLLRLQAMQPVNSGATGQSNADRVELINTDFALNLQNLAETANAEKLLSFQQQLAQMSRYYSSNAQPQLLLENLLTYLQ